MTVQADANGVINTTIRIPANVPAGSKRVEVQGAGGSQGEATFVGKGTIVNRELRQVTTQRVVRRSTDPLAQTFTLGESRLVGGADIFFKVKGGAGAANNVVVQIRGVTVGFPNDEVFCEGIIDYDDINTFPNATRATWSPVMLDADRPYALVVLTDDPDHALAVAVLGKYDSQNQVWVSSQPYQIGTLLSSSNAQTWTPHQNMDMKFNLLAAKFDPTPRTINLGTTSATDATDLVVLAGVERPTAECDCAFEMELDDGTVIHTPEEQAASLLANYTGDVQVRAKLTGTEKHSPVLYGGVQAVKGAMQLTGDYVTRAVEASGQSDVTVTFERHAPSGSNILVECEIDSSGTWTEVPFISGKQVDASYTEVVHKLDDINPTQHVRFRLTLAGTAAARPRARALRAIVT